LLPELKKPPFCGVKNLLKVFRGHNTRFVAGLIGMVSLEFRSNQTLFLTLPSTGR
jgi:hypothetical protein